MIAPLTAADQGVFYVRASKDPDKTRSSTSRQIAQGRERVAEQGLAAPVAIYEDDDLSATKRGVVRDDFVAMVRDMATKGFKWVWIWEKERLNRSLTDFELVTNAAIEHGIKFLVDNKWFDPADDDEWALAGIGAVFGSRESRKLRRRTMDGIDRASKEGRPYGSAGFGFRAVYELGPGGATDRKSRREVVHQPEKEILLDLAHKVVAGVPINALCRDLEARGILTSRGNSRWHQASLRALLLRPKLVGDRVRKGVVVAQGQWEPIFDRKLYAEVQAAFERPRKYSKQNRAGGRGRPPSQLLSGVIQCGVCDSVMYADKMGGRINYACSDPGRHVCRSIEIPNAVIRDHVLAWLTSDEAAEIVEASRTNEGAQTARQAQAVRDQLDQAARGFVAKVIDFDQLTIINGELRPELERLEALLAQQVDAPVFSDLVGPRAAELWVDLPLTRQRAVVAELFVVHMLRVGKGRRSTRDHVRVVPRIRLGAYSIAS